MFSLRRPDSAPRPEVLVVIGAHRDELAFGDQVAARLDGTRFDLLRIPQGLSGEHPRPDQVALFRQRHQDLYLQLLDHVASHHRLLVDLHCGINQAGYCGDVLCADHRLLDSVAEHASDLDAQVRCISLVSDTRTASRISHLVARPEIPEAVWNRPNPIYVGLEVYLSTEGSGSQQERRFAESLIGCVADCSESLRDRNGQKRLDLK
ncbi:hypothetical protein [Imhoffiella purpurea]|uniref:Uncharacterized protein n=1 Tax=Imhoffiella purpurea TaxID=1249627 RepID=W9VDR5_9GAMM|nr:hypothetical protein [Imhoffiella purpurea]EXJ14187.1 hypothetical protein D779_2858 [Imhoffiella purpurea]